MEEISKEDLDNRQISSHSIDGKTAVQDSLLIVNVFRHLELRYIKQQLKPTQQFIKRYLHVM